MERACEPVPEDHDDFVIWNYIRLLNHAMTRLRNRELERYGLTTQQAVVLWLVRELGGDATPTRIARRMLREPATLSNILARMEDQGLLQRMPGTQRYNTARFTLTKRGEAAYEGSLVRESMHCAAERLTPAQRRQLKAAVRTMIENVLDALDLSESQRSELKGTFS